MLKHGALCIHVLYTTQEQEEEAKRIKEKDMLQVQTVWTLHWSMPTKVGGAASTKPVRPVLAVADPQEHIKCNQASKASHKTRKGQVSRNKSNALAIKVKSHICYTCRSKGHESKNCPNGKIPKPIPVHYGSSKLGDNFKGTYATRVMSSSQSSKRAIWTPKSLVTNLKGPNMVCIPKSAC